MFAVIFYVVVYAVDKLFVSLSAQMFENIPTTLTCMLVTLVPI